MTKRNSEDMKAESNSSEEAFISKMNMGLHTPRKVSRITCVVNNNYSDRVIDFLKRIEVDAYVENGRTVREYIKPKAFGLPGTRLKLQSTVVCVFRFTIPQEYAQTVMKSIIAISELHIPGRGTIFSQDLLEFSQEPASANLIELEKSQVSGSEINFLTNLSYVTCVLPAHEAGEQLARTTLELGVCVPLLTYGTANDLRDQLGLIRVTISPEKEIVHLVMPRHDSSSIIRLLAEETKLDRPGHGYIYKTPVSFGLIDTRMKVGKQNYAASIDQIIAAIDTLKMGTDWRKRLDAEFEKSVNKSFVDKSNYEISIISEEDRIDELRETCITVGAMGTVASRLSTIRSDKKTEEMSTLIRSEINLPSDMADKVLFSLLEISQANGWSSYRIQVLRSSPFI